MQDWVFRRKDKQHSIQVFKISIQGCFCLFITSEFVYSIERGETMAHQVLHSSMLMTDDTTQYHGICPVKRVRPSTYHSVLNSQAGVIISPTSNRWTNYITYRNRIEIVHLYISRPSAIYSDSIQPLCALHSRFKS